MYKLVIIDDESIVIQGIKALIPRIRNDVSVVGWAGNGLEGYDVIVRESPEIVITDIFMPGMDGISLIESVYDLLPNTVFVVISGYQEFAYAQKALKLGVVDYIDKPATIPKIREALRRTVLLLEQKRRIHSDGDVVFAHDVQEAFEQENRLQLKEALRKFYKEIKSQKAQHVAIQEVYHTICTCVSKALGKDAEQFFKQNNVKPVDFIKMEESHTTEAYFLDLLDMAFDAINEDGHKETGINIQKITAYIDKKFAAPLSLTGIAEEFAVNPTYLSARFREITGTNFIKYLTNRRMEEAKLLLAKGYKVSKTCEAVGYSNYRYFCDVFKKQTGLTPAEYRATTAAEAGFDEEEAHE